MSGEPAPDDYIIPVCSRCSSYFVIQFQRYQFHQTLNCPVCGFEKQRSRWKYNHRDAKRSYAERDLAVEMRARLQAKDWGLYDEYTELDGYVEQEERVIEKGKAKAQWDHIDKKQYTGLYEERADDHIESHYEEYGEEADAALEGHHDAFKAELEAYQEQKDDRDPYADAVEDAYQSFESREEFSLNARTGELILATECADECAASFTLDDSTTIVRDGDSAAGLWSQLFADSAIRSGFLNGLFRLSDGLSELDIQRLVATIDPPPQLYGPLIALCRDRTVPGLLESISNLGARRERQTYLVALARLVSWQPQGEDATCTIRFEVDRSFWDVRAKTRQRICQVLAALAQHNRVIITGSQIELRKLATAELEGEPFNADWTTHLSPPEIDSTRVLLALTHDCTGVAILEALAAEHDRQLSYSQLAAKLDCSKATITNWINTRSPSLNDLNLVQTARVSSEKIVMATSGGISILGEFRRERAVQTELGDYDEPVDSFFNSSTNSSEHAREAPGCQEGSGGRADPRTKGKGLATVRGMSRSWAAGTVACGEGVDVQLIDKPLPKPEDNREPDLFVDRDRREVVVSTVNTNPMQYLCSTARAFTDSRVKGVLKPAMESQDFASQLENRKMELRSERCLGYLPDSLESPDQYIGRLQQERNEIEELTTELSKLANATETNKAEIRSRRSLIAAKSLGLTCAVIHLMDILDIDVHIQFRLYDFSSNWERDDKLCWTELTETIGNLISICSTYRNHVAHRQLYEHRRDRLRWTYTPTVDADNPLGEVLPNVTIVSNFGDTDGDKVDRFTSDLKRTLTNPGELREDAPEFGIPITLGEFDFTRSQFAMAVTRICSEKDLQPTREAVSTFSLLAASPLDVAWGLEHLDPDNDGREIRLSEVRMALSYLSHDRLLSEETEGAQKLIHGLLQAERPLTQAEITDSIVSRDTFTNTDSDAPGDRLRALGILVETDDGRWRLSLPFNLIQDSDSEFAGEKYESRAPEVLEAPDDPLHFFLWDVIDRVDPDAHNRTEHYPAKAFYDIGEYGRPDLRPILYHYPWLDNWIARLELALGVPSSFSLYGDGEWSPNRTELTFGNLSGQASIQSLESAATRYGCFSTTIH